jgi:hypothetical protein
MMPLKNDGIVLALYLKAILPPRPSLLQRAGEEHVGGRPEDAVASDHHSDANNKNSALISQVYFIAIFLPMVRFRHPVFIRGGWQTLNSCIVAFGESLAYSTVVPSS